MLWMLESGIFGEKHPLVQPALDAGHNVMHRDSFDNIGFVDGPVMFHGSMNVAQKLARFGRWKPGSFCDEDSHLLSKVTMQLEGLMLNQRAFVTTARQLVSMPKMAADAIGTTEAFCRPISPLKHFCGRLIDLDASLLPEDLDFGFYYDDFDLPVMVAPRKKITREWRFVMMGKHAITCSEYDAKTRKSVGPSNPPGPYEVAFRAGNRLSLKDGVYMLDIAETDEGYKVIETNPFSGSDLYNCELDEIVDFVAQACLAVS